MTSPISPLLALCVEAERFSGPSRAEEDAKRQHQTVAALISKGWTPHLHEAACRASWPHGPRQNARQLFSRHGGHGEIFDLLLREFPLHALDFALPLPDKEPANRWSPSKEKPLSTAWSPLGFEQRSALVRRAGSELLSPPQDCSQWPSWLRAVSHALMPSSEQGFSDYLHGRLRPVEPFFGYFASGAWSELKSAQPALAHALALHLFCACSLAEMERARNPERDSADVQAWVRAALDADQGLEQAPPPQEPWTKLDLLVRATMIEAVRRDRPLTLMALVKAMRMDPTQAEIHHLDLCGRGSFDAALGLSKSKVHPWLMALASSKARLADAWNFENLARWAPPGAPPLFTLCACAGAGACWDALESLRCPPLDQTRWVRHGIKLASPVGIRQRMVRALEAAKARSAPESSMAEIRSNLEAEAQRAEATLRFVELPEPLLRALWRGEPGQASGSPRAPLPPKDSPAAREFDKACEQALARVLEGKQNRIGLDVLLPYSWSVHLLASGAKPSFLEGKLGFARLGDCADVLDLASSQGLRGTFDGAELAALERAQLRAQSSQALARPKSSRL